jgi:hypothetical protein
MGSVHLLGLELGTSLDGKGPASLDTEELFGNDLGFVLFYSKSCKGHRDGGPNAARPVSMPRDGNGSESRPVACCTILASAVDRTRRVAIVLVRLWVVDYHFVSGLWTRLMQCKPLKLAPWLAHADNLPRLQRTNA